MTEASLHGRINGKSGQIPETHTHILTYREENRRGLEKSVRCSGARLCLDWAQGKVTRGWDGFRNDVKPRAQNVPVTYRRPSGSGRGTCAEQQRALQAREAVKGKQRENRVKGAIASDR